MRKLTSHASAFFLGILMAFTVIPFKSHGQAPISLTLDADRPLAEVQPTMWGLFFEDISFAADGGLYAELVKNRSFEFPKPTEGWEIEGSSFFRNPLQIINRTPVNPDNPRVARINVDGQVCMINRGFRGMGIRGNEAYEFSLNYTVISGEVSLQVLLIGEDGMEIGRTSLTTEGREWTQGGSVFPATGTARKASLKLCFEGEGVIEIDMVSLFPVNTWKKRSKGLRADLVQMLADLEPGFLRFPGGCIVEGRDLEKRYQWKNTVGDIDKRSLLINRWNDENSRATSDYFQTFGLGFYEYFLLAEDLGTEPVPILNCGMACQFNTGELVAMEHMEPYVQDALDLIEFANGPAESRWGRLRADMGHPEPFRMKYLGIGNEQWGPQYFERYALFEEALGEAHPEIMLISSTGPMPGGPLFEYGAEALKQFHPALVDEHYYNSPDWFFSNATRYDSYDRDTYKIFAGEYAAANVRMASPENRNIWLTALSEAAFMTGLERNADVVYMASYAPLLAHTEAWQWTPDLIWFDNLESFGTPNYYVQKLFSTNSGTHTLNIHRDGENVTGMDGLYASSVWDANEGSVIVKFVNKNERPLPVKLSLNTGKKFSTAAEKTVLQCNDLEAENSIADPERIAPLQVEEIKISRNGLTLDLDPYSLTVITIKQK